MGDNNAIVVQILSVVVLLFMFFVTYMNTKTWRALHVTFLLLVFVAGYAYLVLAGLNMKSRAAWMKVVEKNEREVEKLKADLELKQVGERKLPKTVLGWRDVREAIHRTILDRGRVWRNLTFAEAQAGDGNAAEAEVKVTLKSTPPVEGQPGKPIVIEEKTLVYAFKDLSANDATKYVYIGEFYVSALAEGSVSLTSTMPLTAAEQGLVAGNQPWVLYELMPQDSHQAFTNDPNVALETLLSPEMFSSAQLHQATLDDYKRDGGPAKDTDPPETVFAIVKFEKEYKMTVDSPDPRSPISNDGRTSPFDAEGQAYLPTLRRGKEVEFKPGDVAEILFSGKDNKGDIQFPGAEQLAEQGIVTIQEKIYRRPLNDYSYEFRHIWARKRQILASLRTLEFELKRVKAEIAATEANIKLQTDRAEKLDADVAKATDEKEKITKYVAQLNQVFLEAKQQFNALVVQNNSLHQQIVSATERLLSAAERRRATPASLRQ